MSGTLGIRICYCRRGYSTRVWVEASNELESQAVNPETEIRLGTSAFIAAGWESAFYPPGMKPAKYLTYYLTQFDIVEVDSTFYRPPSQR